MAVKEWFRKLRPVQLYVILILTIAYFVIEIVASYVTHALTLLMNAYHMLCNIVALIGCIASIKCERDCEKSCDGSIASLASLKNSTTTLDSKVISVVPSEKKKSKLERKEKRMKNTFGWARIDIVTMLVCCVLLASFCFSLLVEALQTLVHISHQDAMHLPIPVMTIGASGILLNAFCYFLIGGYTFNQGIFLHFTRDGNVILKRNISNSQSSGVGSIDQTIHSPLGLPKSQGLREMCRDVLGCVLVMVASGLVYFTEDRQIAKYIDPVFAIISAVLVLVLSYPYMKESGMILLQTIPNHINIDSLQKELMAAFPDIVNVHDLHVWQLNGEKVVSTVHIIYADPTVLSSRITDQITAFFVEMGITHVTIQPEFCNMKPYLNPQNDCLIRCQSKTCNASTCCSPDLLDDHHHHHHHHHSHSQIVNKKFGSKEILPRLSSKIDLTKFKINVNEINEVTCSNPDVTILNDKPSIKVKAISASELTIEVQSKESKENNQRCTVNVDVVKSDESEELPIIERNNSDNNLDESVEQKMDEEKPVIGHS